MWSHAILLVLALSPPKQVDASSPWPWPSLEETRPTQEWQTRSQLLGWLLSPEEGVRTEAQLRLLPLGQTLLPELEALAARTREPGARERLREFLDVLTWHEVPLTRLAAYPALSGLVRMEQARRLISPWMTEAPAKDVVLSMGGASCGLDSTPPYSLHIEGKELERAMEELALVGELARPAVELLMSSSSAHARLRGMALAASLQLRPGPALQKDLLKDEAKVEVRRSSTSTFKTGTRAHTEVEPVLVSIAAITSGLHWKTEQRSLSEKEPVTSWVGDRVQRWYAAAYAPRERPFDAFRDSGLAELFSQIPFPRGTTAQDEQEFWNTARPLWRAWWRSGARALGSSEEARQNRAALLSSYQGLQHFQSKRRADDPVFLQLSGRAGTEVELRFFAEGRSRRTEVRRGVLPLSLEGVSPGRLIDIRVRTEGGWMDVDLHFALPPETRTTVWLEPRLRHAHIQRVEYQCRYEEFPPQPPKL